MAVPLGNYSDGLPGQMGDGLYIRDAASVIRSLGLPGAPSSSEVALAGRVHLFVVSAIVGGTTCQQVRFGNCAKGLGWRD
ncbi:hypothetical protein ES703_90953 [subsurface metagenome]